MASNNKINAQQKNTIHAHGYAAQKAKGKLAPFAFERSNSGPHDILIEILYCGVCHSDIHQVNNDWGFSAYPIVPGHEVVGRVIRVGSSVKKFSVGDRATIGQSATCFKPFCCSIIFGA